MVLPFQVKPGSTVLSSLCRERDGILLIVGRRSCAALDGLDLHLLFSTTSLQPDLVCMSKGITGGYIPFGAVWTGPRISEYYYDTEKMVLWLNVLCPSRSGLAALEAMHRAHSPSQHFRRTSQSLERLFRTSNELDELQKWPEVSTVRCTVDY